MAVIQSLTPPADDAPYAGKWLPYETASLERWLSDITLTLDTQPSTKELSLEVKALQDLIEGDTRLFMHASAMFDEMEHPEGDGDELTDGLGRPQVNSYMQMLQIMDLVLTTAPKWDDFVFSIGWVGFPINVILNWPMSTSSGKAFFLDERVNACLGRILNAWGAYLSSEMSACVVTTNQDGWLSTNALRAIEAVANAGDNESFSPRPFTELFECDPSKPHWGYASWDDFFTRRFRPGIRPVADPQDDSVIVNPCESKPYRLSRDVRYRDSFWVKGQPYSIHDMLAHDPLAIHFTGGTVYQAFLSSLSYHRWHSPVKGVVVKTGTAAGTYYSKAPSGGYGTGKTSLSPSQGYLAEVATRSFVYIQADNPAIGLVCLVAVGMAEVSTCETTVAVGQRVTKGGELGMFHFGGSTFCLLFGPQANLQWTEQAGSGAALLRNIPLNAKIASVIS
jgi:phosphatidylserine decarboxylase